MKTGKKEEGKMKRLAMAALLIIALSTGAFAHQGSIGLFTTTSAATGGDCDDTIGPYAEYEIAIVYFRSDSGPDGIFAAEFKLDVPPGTVVIGGFEPSAAISVTMGDLATGIACSYAFCTGAGDDYTLIGTATITSFLVDTPFQMRIMASDALPAPPYEPIVAMCDDPERTIVGVLGGWFSNPDGTCALGTEEKTWGAIKEMYKD